MSLGPLQFVDDIKVPCSLAEEVAAVCDDFGKYAAKVNAVFKYGPTKTCAMSIGSCRSDPILGCSFVRSRRLLGVLVDNKLAFDKALAEAVARGYKEFTDFSMRLRWRASR